MKILVPSDGVVSITLPPEFVGATLLVNVEPDSVNLLKALVIEDRKPQPTQKELS